jgi:hypothetical protein
MSWPVRKHGAGAVPAAAGRGKRQV